MKKASGKGKLRQQERLLQRMAAEISKTNVALAQAALVASYRRIVRKAVLSGS